MKILLYGLIILSIILIKIFDKDRETTFDNFYIITMVVLLIIDFILELRNKYGRNNK